MGELELGFCVFMGYGGFWCKMLGDLVLMGGWG